MKKQLQQYLTAYPFPDSAVQELLTVYDKVMTDTQTRAVYTELLDAYRADYRIEYDHALLQMQCVGETLGIHIYTANLFLIVSLAALARDHYKREGLPFSLYSQTMRDVYYKYEECRLIYGVTGTFVPVWFWRFFRLERFAFGLLQMECESCRADVDFGTAVVYEGDTVLNLHIPRSGKRLTPTDVECSLKEGVAFMKKRYRLTSPIFVVISSWLLFPEHRHMLHERSNIRAFMDSFRIVHSGEYKDYSEVWRLFDKNYEGDPDALPADSSLRRAYIERIKQGESLGWGYGVRLYE